MSGAGERIGYWGAVAIGVGGMVGGGIFAVLGLAVQLARGGTPIAFAIAGVVALLTAYAYAKLSVRYPSRGGTVVFLDRAFGVDLLTGTFNSLLWLSYMVMVALYAFAFGSYGATFFAPEHRDITTKVLVAAGILVPTAINTLNARIIGRAETWVVALKLLILSVFVAVGLSGVDTAALSPTAWAPAASLVAGGMIIFVAYEGFELIANSAEDVAEPRRTLPRAFYSSVGFVLALYVLIAVVAVGSLPVDRIVSAKDYALAAAAEPVLGHAGFVLISVAALLSTFSAINATLYGASRLSYAIAKEGELPQFLEQTIWNEHLDGLLITAAVALVLGLVGDIESISTMGSAGFLLIFGAVNAANVKLHRETGSRRWISALGVLACVAALGALIWQTVRTDPSQLWILAAMVGLAFTIEALYRLWGRELKLGR
ncbi:MAG: amino acid permease [Deltaproteobacteria bacterium]|nr:amino acid permease [Deltaproteobacteria bacterium]